MPGSTRWRLPFRCRRFGEAILWCSEVVDDGGGGVRAGTGAGSRPSRRACRGDAWHADDRQSGWWRNAADRRASG